MSMWGALGLPALIVSVGICYTCIIVGAAYAMKLNAEAESIRQRGKGDAP